MARHPNPDPIGHLVRRGLKFSQLRLLSALRETGHIGAAAAQTGMTQPAASRLLSQLDALIGTPLYTRHTRGVAMTQAGQILADQATAILKGLDRAHQEVSQIRDGARGHVRIGSVTGPSLQILLPVLQTARRTYPDISMTVQVDISDGLVDALLAGDLDLYIGRIPDSVDARAFAIEMIGIEPVSLLVRRDHPLLHAPEISLAASLDYDWVMQPPGGLLRRTTETFLLQHGLPLPPRVVGTTSLLFTLAMIYETDAIAPVARAVADFYVERAALATLPLAPDMAVRDYGIVMRQHDQPSPATERILSLIRDHITTNGTA